MCDALFACSRCEAIGTISSSTAMLTARTFNAVAWNSHFIDSIWHALDASWNARWSTTQHKGKHDDDGNGKLPSSHSAAIRSREHKRTNYAIAIAYASYAMKCANDRSDLNAFHISIHTCFARTFSPNSTFCFSSSFRPLLFEFFLFFS